jgi:hypothetical protein
VPRKVVRPATPSAGAPTPTRPARPAAPKPAAAAAPTPVPARPARPARPAEPGATAAQAPAQPARPARPSAPGVVRPAEPAHPAAGDADDDAGYAGAMTPEEMRHQQEVAVEAEHVAHVEAEAIDQDDQMNAPAPSHEYLGHAAPYRPPPRMPVYKTIGFRRTLIPVCLVLGVMLPVMGAVKFVADPDATAAAMAPWLSGTLIALGLLLLVIGVLNMLAVKQQLEAARET